MTFKKRRQHNTLDPPVSYNLLETAKTGDVEAIQAILKIYDPYIRKVANIYIGGSAWFNEDLYERMRTKIILLIIKFEL